MVVEVGRVAVKLAGRDAGRRCVIVDLLDGPYVLIDGETRRRKCNVSHLELLEQKVEVHKGSSHESLQKVFDDLGFSVWNSKPKEAKPRPKAIRKKKEVKADGKKKPVKAVKKTVDATVVPAEAPKAEPAKPKKAPKKKVQE